MPWNDWQFWIVTLLALCGLWVLVRPLLPRRKSSGSNAGCPNCTSADSPERNSRRVTLTIHKHRV